MAVIGWCDLVFIYCVTVFVFVFEFIWHLLRNSELCVIISSTFYSVYFIIKTLHYFIITSTLFQIFFSLSFVFVIISSKLQETFPLDFKAINLCLFSFGRRSGPDVEESEEVWDMVSVPVHPQKVFSGVEVKVRYRKFYYSNLNTTVVLVLCHVVKFQWRESLVRHLIKARAFFFMKKKKVILAKCPHTYGRVASLSLLLLYWSVCLRGLWCVVVSFTVLNRINMGGSNPGLVYKPWLCFVRLYTHINTHTQRGPSERRFGGRYRYR